MRATRAEAKSGCSASSQRIRYAERESDRRNSRSEEKYCAARGSGGSDSKSARGCGQALMESAGAWCRRRKFRLDGEVQGNKADEVKRFHTLVTSDQPLSE